MRYTIRPMGPSDVPAVVAIDRLSFPTPWSSSAFLHELKRRRSHYYVLSRSRVGEPASSEPERPQWWHQLLGPLMGGSRAARRETSVVGYVGFRFQSKEAHITTIAVHPDWRGRGLGELLLLTAVEKTLDHPVNAVTLEMRPSNRVAQNLYRKYGFQLNEIQQGYYRNGEDAWVMEAEVHRRAYQARLDELHQALEDRLLQQRIEVGQKEGDNL